MVLAAQMSLTCTDKVTLPVPGNAMPAMPGMDAAVPAMGSASAIMVCPIVLALIVASALLTAAAVARLWRDPHRALAQRAILMSLAQLPPARTVAVLALGGASAVGGMLWLERSGTPAPPVCAMLAALLFACSLTLTLGAIVAGRIAIAFGRRLLIAIAAVIARSRPAATPCAQRCVFTVSGAHAVPLLAAGRGLRAPPLFVR
jgi:hypothetical protein